MKKIGHYLPEFLLFISSLLYIVVQIVSDVTGISYLDWFLSVDIPALSLPLIVILLMYRSKEKE